MPLKNPSTLIAGFWIARKSNEVAINQSGWPLTCCDADLNEEVEDDKRNDNNEEDGRRIGDDANRWDDVEEKRKETTDQIRKNVVDCFDVSRETIQDSTDRSRVEEHHWRTENIC